MAQFPSRITCFVRLRLKDSLKDVCRIELGNLVLLNKSLVFEVQGVRTYPSFFDMLETEGLGKVLPGVESVEEGVKIYRRFYTEEMEQANGVLAISVSKHSVQPYTSLASLFSVLSYEGVQGLLGLTHTTGTVPNALPPPRSTLLASFNFPCNPNVVLLESRDRVGGRIHTDYSFGFPVDLGASCYALFN